MAASLFTDLPRATDANGSTLSGAEWYFYLTGTTTATEVYADSGLDTPLANPVPADAGGLFATIYLNPAIAYRAVLKTSGGTVLRDIDPVVQSNGTTLDYPSRYSSFAAYLASLSTGFFSQNNADIQRFERGLLGAARRSDAAFPNVEQDWLTVFQVAAGLSAGAVVSSQFAALNDGTTSTTGAVGVLGGIQSKYFASAGTSAIGVSGYVVNNNATYATNAWAFYGEAHKTNAASGSTYFIEGDTRSTVATLTPHPYQQGDVVWGQIASGAELSAVGQYDASAGLQFAPNPMKFKVGINVMATALTADGSGYMVFAALPVKAETRYYDSSGRVVGAFGCENTDYTKAVTAKCISSGFGLFDASGNTVFLAAPVAGTAANYLTVGNNNATASPYLAALGSDTNISIQIAPKGTGLVQFGNAGSFAANGSVATTMTSLGPTGSHTTVQEWLQVKNSSGTVRYIPLY